jgi:two-component system, chemotaxis family, protein-glutamate methylesterase/glutaminase
MPTHDLIVIGASAGGVEALMEVARGLPPDLPAAVIVVLHLPAGSPSFLPQILARAGALPAEHARDGAPILAGRIYVAPPDHHLLVQPGVLSLSRGPQENRHRPAIDPLFRSAALAYGQRVVAVVLTGMLDDGTAGLAAVKRRGGVAVVQDPGSALFPSMPQQALAHVDVDVCVPLPSIAAALVRLAGTPVIPAEQRPPSSDLKEGVKVAEFAGTDPNEPEPSAVPSVYACPACHGVLFEIDEGTITRYRCRVGHAYSQGSLQASQDEAVEEALWTALRALEEKAGLARRLQARAEGRRQFVAAAQFAESVAEAEQRAQVLRDVLGAKRVDEPVQERPREAGVAGD